jgi:tetratricopeptide (TPR) repeat protein
VRALELGAQDGLTAGLLAYCHAREGHHQAALDAYRLALLTQPGERQWQIGAAQALLALKQPRAAADILQALLDRTPGDVPLWLIQADTRIALEEELRAAANLEIVHRAGRLEADAIASLGHLYLQNGLPDLAQERYEAALRKEPFLSPARALEIVELFLSQSDWTRAKTVSGWIEASPHYREAFSAERAEKPLLSRLTRARALLELETGDAAAGAKRVEEWLRREPMDGHALLLLARFREEANQRVEAAMLLEQAARIPETAAAAHLAHGRLLVAEGNYEKALEHLDESQKLDPDESVSRYLEAVRELAGGPQG